MNNNNDEENIKTFFIEKINKDNTNETYLTRKIFEEYVKCKNAVNISIQNNKLMSKNSITKNKKKNIINYNNIKYWIKTILIPNDNDLSTKKSYSYVNIKSKQIPKPLGDLNFPFLYSSKNIKINKKSIIFSNTNSIFNHINLCRAGQLEEERKEEEFIDETIMIKLKQYYDNDQDSLLHILQIGPPDSFRLITWNIINNISYINNLNFILNNNSYNANEIYKKFLLKDLEKNKSD